MLSACNLYVNDKIASCDLVLILFISQLSHPSEEVD